MTLFQDPNTTCSNFQTPLHWASMIGHLDICKFLCEYGANKDAQNYNGMTPLMLAVSSNHDQLGKFTTVSHWKLVYDSLLVQYFVTEKVNMHLTNKRGDTVLHVAAKRGHVNMMLLLIQNGADMKRKNYSGQLPEVSALTSKIQLSGRQLEVHLHLSMTMIILVDDNYFRIRTSMSSRHITVHA